MMMSSKERRLLGTVKSRAFKLKENGQIPYCLYRAIVLLHFNSTIEEVRQLISLTDEYMRRTQFYILFPEKSEDCRLKLEELHIKY